MSPTYSLWTLSVDRLRLSCKLCTQIALLWSCHHTEGFHLLGVHLPEVDKISINCIRLQMLLLNRITIVLNPRCNHTLLDSLGQSSSGALFPSTGDISETWNENKKWLLHFISLKMTFTEQLALITGSDAVETTQWTLCNAWIYAMKVYTLRMETYYNNCKLYFLILS